MFIPSLPSDHFSAPKALLCPMKMAVLTPKMTHKQTCYHGNEQQLFENCVLSLHTGAILTKRLRGQKNKSLKGEIEQKHFTQFFTKNATVPLSLLSR